MLNRSILILVAALIMTGPAVWAKELKIGVVNLQRALNETEEGKQVLAKLKDKLNKDTGVLKKKQEELKALQDEVNQQGFLLSESARKEKETRLRTLSRNVERYREDVRAEFLQMQREATAKMFSGVMKVVREYAKDEGYDLVFEAGTQAAGGSMTVLYFGKEVDLTDKMIELYNKKSAKK